ncbi:MAG: aminopeptidase P family protein [Desulfobacteraceae bacterium]|nr:aminopeptidase P family protein [Desulfobacteraceae bacterium]
MNTNEKIALLRKQMADRNIAAFVVPSGDPHQSENVADHWQVRQWLTGFTGSAGTAVVTRESAVLWTDFRYWIQAASQLKGTSFELFKQGDDGVPEFETWLSYTLCPGDTIAMDGNMVSVANVKKYRKLFKQKGISLVSDIDFISDIWLACPPLPASKAWMLSTAYAGRTRLEKLELIRNAMEKAGANAYLMTTLDDIAWTFNLRGEDVHTNPVNLAFALVTLDKATLFINPDKVDAGIISQFEQDKIELLPYELVKEKLSSLGEGISIHLDPEAVGDTLYNAIDTRAKIIEKVNPATELKAVKNEIEIDHMRKTAVKDGIAMVNFLYWLENKTDETKVSEMDAAAKVFEFRKEQPDFVDNSFDSIMAYGEHSAMCHYRATSKSDAVLKKEGMFLADSGGNYLTGTTDITRTMNLGTPTKQQICDYTLVLKGHIAVATALFPKGTKGFQIDTLARQFLWKEGINFGHGTGHGVGFFLGVHEGPARISPHPVDVELKKGMLLTNEPGVYREGHYGIRLENMILVDEAFKTEFGNFLKFENMTLCHFETSLMDKKLFSREEVDYINGYHKKVYERLSSGLDPEVAAWLQSKTEPI